MDNKEPYQRNRNDLLRDFESQLMFMRAHMDQIASGNREFYKPLSINIRVVFHQTRKSHSLLNQLDIENRIQMASTSSKYSPSNLIPHTGLIALSPLSNFANYLPIRDTSEVNFLNYHQWWDEEIVMSNNSGKLWSRKELVTEVANKDGGGHIDSNIPIEFYNLSYRNALGWKFVKGSDEAGIEGVLGQLCPSLPLGYPNGRELND
ncbi:hypothetical protein [Algoriphagus resistens]|uniref:hypothetical protein n=1 Tax=Algoriphagus resistens TaxID=1750590 RepID=UPI000ACDD7EC|nr:hypothetical protein [Algoriphagus resistens]